MRDPADLHRLHAGTVDRWRTIALSTEPIDQNKARGAIARLATELNGKPPRVVLAFNSPRECRIAARYLRPDLIAPADHTTPHHLMRARMANRFRHISRPSGSFIAAGDLMGIVASLQRRALSPVPMAVEPAGRTEFPSTVTLPVSRALMSAVGHLDPGQRSLARGR